METIRCRRCGYESTYLYLLKRHLSKKVICENVYEDIPITELLKELDDFKNEKQFQCKFCKKIFSDSGNRYRHQKTCKQKEKEEINNLKETISHLQEQVCSLQKQNIPITTNNFQTINNNFNITLNNFGNESYSHISDDFLSICVRNNLSGVKKLIERIHFSNEAPENKNVRMRSLKNNLVEVSDNQKWVVKDANEAMETMINKGCRLLNGYYYNQDTGLMNEDINDLDTRIQTFLLSIIDKNNKYYFALRRRILALIIEHSDQM